MTRRSATHCARLTASANVALHVGGPLSRVAAVIDDPEISQLRLQIDDVDLRILGLLTERVRYVLAVGDHKRKKGLGVTDPERERRLLDRLASEVEAPLDAATVRRIFECIVTESRRIEHEHVQG